MQPSTYLEKIQVLLEGRELVTISSELSYSGKEPVHFLHFNFVGGTKSSIELPAGATEEILKEIESLTPVKKMREKSNQQVCAHLEIEDFYTSSKDTLGDLMALQKDIQENIYGYNFDQVQDTLGTVKEFIDWNYAADQDEWRELYNALGGVDSHGSAIWKPWKSKHKEALAKKFSELSETELKELHMEIVDRFHFFINICLATGLDAKTLFNYYYAKNKENRERQKRVGGY